MLRCGVHGSIVVVADERARVRAPARAEHGFGRQPVRPEHARTWRHDAFVAGPHEIPEDARFEVVSVEPVELGEVRLENAVGRRAVEEHLVLDPNAAGGRRGHSRPALRITRYRDADSEQGLSRRRVDDSGIQHANAVVGVSVGHEAREGGVSHVGDVAGEVVRAHPATLDAIRIELIIDERLSRGVGAFAVEPMKGVALDVIP